jgi:hypothetical protein
LDGSSGRSTTGVRRFAGYHLYYPSRRQSAPALLIDARRYRGLASEINELNDSRYLG